MVIYLPIAIPQNTKSCAESENPSRTQLARNNDALDTVLRSMRGLPHKYFCAEPLILLVSCCFFSCGSNSKDTAYAKASMAKERPGEDIFAGFGSRSDGSRSLSAIHDTSSSEWIPIIRKSLGSQQIKGSADLSAWYAARWDEQNLYYLFRIVDDVKIDVRRFTFEEPPTSKLAKLLFFLFDGRNHCSPSIFFNFRSVTIGSSVNPNAIPFICGLTYPPFVS